VPPIDSSTTTAAAAVIADRRNDRRLLPTVWSTPAGSASYVMVSRGGV